MSTADARILPAAQAILIDRNGRATVPFYDLLRRLVAATGSIAVDISGATFLTLNNETASLANSKQLAAGANITLTDDGAQLVIAASAGGGVSAAGYPPQLGYAGI